MALKKKKVSARRQHVRKTMSPERFARLAAFANSTMPIAFGVLMLFIVAATALLSIETAEKKLFDPEDSVFKPWPQIAAVATLVALVCVGISLYVRHYEPRILRRPTRIIALGGLFLILLFITKVGSFDESWTYLATGSAVTCGIILTIAYNQRFAIGMTLFYSIIACFVFFTIDKIATIELFLMMTAGFMTCCFFLKEIRTRMKLIEVTALAATVVFVTAAALGVIGKRGSEIIFFTSGTAAAITIAVGVVIQGFLPMIEKVFGIATSMTLLDYSDANQPLLKKLAMDAPGTFSHSPVSYTHLTLPTN